MIFYLILFLFGFIILYIYSHILFIRSAHSASPPWMLRCMENWWHGCLGNAWRDWKYYKKLKQIPTRNTRKQIHKIPRIFTRIHLKSMNALKNRSRRCPGGPKWPELTPGGAKAPPKGGQGVPKCPQGGPKGAPDGAKRGPREAKWGPWGRIEVKKCPK